MKLRSIIDTTPAWKPVLMALAHLEAGGRLVIKAIRKEESDKENLILLDYPVHLWIKNPLVRVQLPELFKRVA